MNETARDRALDFVVFCDGLEEAGQLAYARRGRLVAHDLIQALNDVDSARSALATVIADRDRWRDDRWREAHGKAWPR